MLALLVASTLALAAPPDGGLGQQLTVVLPSGARRSVWAGLRPVTLAGTEGLALTQAPGEPGAPSTHAGRQPAVGPWCAVATLFDQPAAAADQAAAVQLAAWKVLQPGLAAEDPQLDLAAAALAADAWKPCRALTDTRHLVVDPAAGLVLPLPAESVADARGASPR